MARNGYLIFDSDLHRMEPDDLWARYLPAPHRTNPPRFFGAQQQQLAESSADKGNADTIEGMVVHGVSISVVGTASQHCWQRTRSLPQSRFCSGAPTDRRRTGVPASGCLFRRPATPPAR
jgi:hypothetical protein